MNSDKNNPISEYLLKLQLIITNTEFKNKHEANKYETLEMSDAAQYYIHAKNETDTFELYQYDQNEILTALYAAYIDDPKRDEKAEFYMQNIHMLPMIIKNKLKSYARERTINKYEEKNKYYVNLTGKPFKSSDSSLNDSIIAIPDAFYDKYDKLNPGILSRNMPIHEMPLEYQDLFINSEYYEPTVNAYPHLTYLRFIGSNAIPIEVARKARDGDILRINLNKLNTYHPKYGVVSVTGDIIHRFKQTYEETRNYVFNTLRGEFQDIYPNYDEFMRFLTIYFTLGNCMNEFLHDSTSLVNINNSVANNLFSLYGLPSVIMEGAPMIDFLKQFRLLLMDKGTNAVYRVKDLIGYEYTDIYSLIMVKQQVFEDGVPAYYYNAETGEYIPKQRIVFRRMGTNDKSNSYFSFRESHKEYLERKFPIEESREDEFEISSGDPRWWESKEVEDALRNMNYTLSNSKYIQLSTHISMKDIWFQSVILLRGLLDLRANTKLSTININYNVNGSTMINVFDAVLCLVIMMNWKLGFTGEMYNSTKKDGISGTYELLGNGLLQGYLYIPGQTYEVGQKVGLHGDDLLYEVKKNNFRATEGPDLSPRDCLLTDISKGYIEQVAELDLTPNEKILGQPFKLASFNFGIADEADGFYQTILNDESGQRFSYLEPDIFMPMVDAALDKTTPNAGTLIMTEVHDIYKYLENKLRDARTIEEFRQVTDVYNDLFLVDPERDWYDNTVDTEDTIKTEFGISDIEMLSIKNAFSIYINENSTPDFSIKYRDIEYNIFLGDLLDNDVKTVFIHPTHEEDAQFGDFLFNDPDFIGVFENALNSLKDTVIDKSSRYSAAVKRSYKEIIKSKIEMDLNLSNDSYDTFEALLHGINPRLYRFIKDMQTNATSETVVLFLRSVIKALSNYTESNLSALEFRALGIDEYMRILKEVISYFKSYMVEFTKDEFIFLFDNILDNGGNSNMLKLFDEFNHKTMIYRPKESVALFDVSQSTMQYHIKDEGFMGMMKDDCIIRIKAPYKTFKRKNVDIWFDHGNQIDLNPFEGLTDDTEVLANLVKSGDKLRYILHVDNVEPDTYYGNKRKNK